jgi:hypothetical protein
MNLVPCVLFRFKWYYGCCESCGSGSVVEVLKIMGINAKIYNVCEAVVGDNMRTLELSKQGNV